MMQDQPSFDGPDFAIAGKITSGGAQGAAPHDASAVSLSGGVDLDAVLADARRLGPAGSAVSGVATDWRRVQPGDAFVAVVTDVGDGHEAARRAVARGAVAVVAERHVPVFHVPQYLVSDTRRAFGKICHELVGRPSERMRVIGVAGTHGKSTTIALLEEIFAAAQVETGVLNSWKSFDGMTRGPGIGATPTAASLASRLARMEASGIAVALVEMTSRGLSRHCYSGIRLDAACVTQVTSSDLDCHYTPHNHRVASHRVLELLSGEGAAILNEDDPVSCEWMAEWDGPVLTYACDADAPITAQIIERHANETVFLLTAGDQTAAVRTTLPGDHFVANCLAAAATAMLYEIDLQTIAKGIESVTRLSSCMERVDCGQGFPLFVDAAAAPDALRATLRTARQLARGRVICVLGDDPPGAATEALAVRSVVNAMADVAIVTDRRAKLDSNWDETVGDRCAVHHAADRGEAVAWAVAMAEHDDIVVVSGSQGRSDFSFGPASHEPSDVERARELLYARQTPALRIAA